MSKDTGAQTVEGYIASLPEPRRTEVAELHGLIRQTVPDLEPTMWPGMIGYGRYHYKYASGREGDSCIVGLSVRKGYVSVYLLGITDEHRTALPTADIGVGCVRFKRLDGVDREAMRRVIHETVESGSAMWGERS